MRRLFILLMLLSVFTGCGALPRFFPGEPESIPNVPRLYTADFDSVWNAAVETLDEMGFVIAQMKKEEGYITTENKRDVRLREKVSIRLQRADSSIEVTVASYVEYFNKVSNEPDSGHWQETKSYGHLEQKIKDRIASKLYAQHN